jgi:hypothetical protein
MHAYIYTALIVVYIISVFLSNPYLDYVVGALSVAAVIIAARHAKGLYFKTGVIFLVIGVSLYIYKGLPWSDFLLQFHSMLGLLSLFLVLPFIHAVIYTGHFDKTIRMLLRQKVEHWDQLYSRGSLSAYMLGNFINLACIPLLAKSLADMLRSFPASAQSFIGRCLLRAYALTLSWSPMEVLVSTSIDMTGVNYLVVFPIMFALAVCTVYIDVRLARIRYRKIPYSPAELRSEADVKRNIIQKIILLSVFLITFIVAVTIVQSLLRLSFLITVVLVLPVQSIVWNLILKKQKRYFTLIAGKWKGHTTGLSNYFFMFLSAGLFVHMVSSTGLIASLQSVFLSTVEQPPVFYFLTALFFLLASLIGFHPLVILTLFAAMVEPMVHQLPAVPLTVVLIACSLATVMYSPFNLSVSLLGNELNMNPFKICFLNLGFAAVYISFSIFAASVLHFI